MDNKLGISDSIELAHAEERISKVAALSLYCDGMLEAHVPGTFETLSAIHQRFFGEVFAFAVVRYKKKRGTSSVLHATGLLNAT